MLTLVRSRIASIPTPAAGLALGIAGLGLGLENALPLHSLGQTIGAVAASCLLLCVACKFLVHPGLLRQDLAHPVAGGILPTFSMSLLLVSKSLGAWHATAGEALWLAGIVLHLLLMAAFAYHRVKSFTLRQILPSWFVPFVGVALGALTVPSPEYTEFAYTLLVFGMINYSILLPVMLYRLIFASKVADAAKPTIAIMAAPASLSLAGYLTLEPEPSLLLCAVLLGIALLMTGLIYIAFFKLLRLPFTPAFAAYTFPLAVGATALYKVAGFLARYPDAAECARQLSFMAVVEMSVATLVVGYVCLRYTVHYARRMSALYADIRVPSAPEGEPVVLP